MTLQQSSDLAADHNAHIASAIAKFFRRIIPMLAVMLIVNQIDRANIGFVKAELQTDAGISAAAFGFGAGLFFIGYALFEVPSNLMLKKLGGAGLAHSHHDHLGYRGGDDRICEHAATFLCFTLSARRGRSGILSRRAVLLSLMGPQCLARTGNSHGIECHGQCLSVFRPSYGCHSDAA